MKIIELEETASTNEYCKNSGIDGDVIVIAKRQSAGKGTKGRSFYSGEGGIYLSVMRKPKSFPAGNAFEIMINSCVAVCKTLEYFQITPVIRWANDVLVNGKKICGTLIENTFSGAYITRSIVGCGLNVNNDFPPELGDIAVSMKQVGGREYDIKNVKKQLVKNLQNTYSIAEYKSYINWLSKPVKLITDGGERVVTALDVLPDGSLTVRDGDKTIKISCAEVSLRI